MCHLFYGIFMWLSSEWEMSSLICAHCFGQSKLLHWETAGTNFQGTVNIIILLIALTCVSFTCLKANAIESCGFWGIPENKYD